MIILKVFVSWEFTIMFIYWLNSAAEALEREKLLAAGSMSDITPQDLLQPHSDFHIRNRYLSRIGASVSVNTNTDTIMLN